MAQRIFRIEDQADFARLSGDYNPVHLDPVVARRTMFGRVVVHGVHALMHGVEIWLRGAAAAGRVRLHSLRASFPRAIGVDERVVYDVAVPEAQRVELQISVRDTPAAWAEIAWAGNEGGEDAAIPSGTLAQRGCLDRTFADAAGASGSLDLCLPDAALASMFPNIACRLPSSQAAVLLALTRLVGMECPGLHSVLGGLALDFSRESGGPRLAWQVGAREARLSRMVIEVRGPGMTGRATAFVRPRPVVQSASRDLRRLLDAGEFRGQRSLVVGGSRGLGEVAAKLLAAGGASVRLTYHRGPDDAARVVDEINEAGGEAAYDRFDVQASSSEALAPLLREGWLPTHLYYFATPPIFVGAAGIFSEDLFRAFCDIYVTGFVRTAAAVRVAAPSLAGVFVPSSVSIDDGSPSMAEYAAAKAAGETAAAYLERAGGGCLVERPRLPRLATDQTATFLPVPSLDPAPVLLRHLRAFRDRTAALRPPGVDPDRA